MIYIKEIILEHVPHNISFSMVSNPEFLRQGSAIKDTMQADRIIIGSNNEEAAKSRRDVSAIECSGYSNEYKKC